MHTIRFLLIVAMLLQAFAADKANAQSERLRLEREIALQGRSSSTSFQRAMFEAELVLEASRRYDANREQFGYYELGSVPGLAAPEPTWFVPRKSEVIAAVREAASLKLDGWDPSTSTRFQLATTIVGLIPHIEAQAAVGLASIFAPRLLGPSDVGASEPWIVGADVLREIERLRDSTNPEQRALHDALVGILKSRADFDPTLNDYSSDPTVRAAHAEALAISTTSSATQSIERLTELQSRLLREGLRRRSYQQQRADARGVGLAIGYGLLLAGNERAATSAFKASELTVAVMDLSRSELTGWEFAGSFMKTLHLGISFMEGSGGQSFETSALSYLREILATLDALRLEMHTRLGQLDTRLWEVNERLVYGLSDIRDGMIELHRKTDQVALALERQTSELAAMIQGAERRLRAEALIECDRIQLEATVARNCVSRLSARAALMSADYQMTHSQISRTFAPEGPYPAARSVGYLLAVVGSSGTDSDRTFPLSFAYPPGLNQTILAGDGNPVAPYYLPNPDIWFQNSHALLALSGQRGFPISAIRSEDIERAILAGLRVQRFYNEVAWNTTGEPRHHLLADHLQRYRETLGGIAQEAERHRLFVDPDHPERGQLDVLKPYEYAQHIGLAYFRPGFPRGSSLVFCSSRPVFHWFNARGAQLGANETAVLSTFHPLPPVVRRMVPIWAALGDYFGRGAVSYCVDEYVYFSPAERCNGSDECFPIPFRYTIRAQFITPRVNAAGGRSANDTIDLAAVTVGGTTNFQYKLPFAQNAWAATYRSMSDILSSTPDWWHRSNLVGSLARPSGSRPVREANVSLSVVGDSTRERQLVERLKLDSLMAWGADRQFTTLTERSGLIVRLLERAEEQRGILRFLVTVGIAQRLSRENAQPVVEALNRLLDDDVAPVRIPRSMYVHSLDAADIVSRVEDLTGVLRGALQGLLHEVPSSPAAMTEGQLRKLCDLRARSEAAWSLNEVQSFCTAGR